MLLTQFLNCNNGKEKEKDDKPKLSQKSDKIEAGEIVEETDQDSAPNSTNTTPEKLHVQLLSSHNSATAILPQLLLIPT